MPDGTHPWQPNVYGLGLPEFEPRNGKVLWRTGAKPLWLSPGPMIAGLADILACNGLEEKARALREAELEASAVDPRGQVISMFAASVAAIPREPPEGESLAEAVET